MKEILSIAINTFRQNIRDRILYGIIIFALIFIGSASILSSLALEQEIFIIKSLGLAGIYLFGFIITIFLGASIIYDEVDKKTTYILLAKPLTRTDIIIGKFAGLLASISLTIAFMTISYIAIVYLNSGEFDYPALASLGLQVMEMGVIITILILFSLITTPLGATIYTILIIYIGHLLSLLLDYAQNAAEPTRTVLTSLYYVLPNLEKFNIRNLIAHNIQISPADIMIPLIYAFLYISLLIYLSKLIFDKKDL